VDTNRTTAALIASLTRPAGRWDAAEALARHLHAEHLLIFVRDGEAGALLPAPGFPRTLPSGRRWRRFLSQCTGRGDHCAELPFPDAATVTTAVGMVADEDADAVLVLLGGEPLRPEVGVVRALLPLLVAAFRGERAAQTAAAQTAVARESARRATILAEALDTARRELQQAMWTRSDFLASASHDLKNPLAAIKGTAQLLCRRAERSGLPEMQRLVAGLAIIDRTATQMTALVNDLLDVTRLHVGRPLEVDRSSIDLVALAHRVADDFGLISEWHRITVQTDVDELIGEWDGRRLERVLANLVSNAIKFSPEGGEVTMSLASEQDADGVWAVLTIADQGLGIPPDDLPRVFDRFHRASNVVGRIGGTGIGLASVKQIVDAHGGMVGVASHEGQGSTFTVRLPRASSRRADRTPLATAS
jgi:signal transduction histidine kinase